MAQAVGVVGVLVAGHDLVEALAQQEQRVVADAVLLTRIAKLSGPVPGLDDGAGRRRAAAAARRRR